MPRPIESTVLGDGWRVQVDHDADALVVHRALPPSLIAGLVDGSIGRRVRRRRQ